LQHQSKAKDCVIPEANKNYLLFRSNTRWELHDAIDAMDSLIYRIVQVWGAKHDREENIGLIAEDASGDVGMFLDKSNQH
jgi:hypothetical protein